MGDAGKFPAARPGVRCMEELSKGKLVVVADDEIVFHVKRRERFAKRGIERIDGFAEVGRLVLGFAEGVAGEHGEAPGGVAQSDLERVVTGVAGRRLIGVAAEIRAERPARAVENLAGGGGVLRVFTERTAGSLSGREISGVAQEQAKRRI